MRHITSACFIAGSAKSLFWDDVVLIFVGSDAAMELPDWDPKLATISSEDPVYLKVAEWSL